MDAQTGATTPPATRRARNKQRVRERVYASAMTLISQKGYEGTSIEEIAEHADVARGTFFNYFPRKEALISAWASSRREKLLDRLELSQLNQHSSAENLERCMAVLGSLNEEEPELSMAMLTAWVKAGRPLDEEPHLGAIFARLVEAGRERGEISTDLTSEQLGEVLRDLYLGALCRWTRRSRVPQESGRLDSELTGMVRLLLHGMAGRAQPAATESQPD